MDSFDREIKDGAFFTFTTRASESLPRLKREVDGVTDLRFEDETDLLRSMGGLVNKDIFARLDRTVLGGDRPLFRFARCVCSFDE